MPSTRLQDASMLAARFAQIKEGLESADINERYSAAEELEDAVEACDISESEADEIQKQTEVSRE